MEITRNAVSTDKSVGGVVLSRGLIRGLVVAVCSILLCLGGYVICQSLGFSKINNSQYQAVFLSNGQVYFGKLERFYGFRPVLKDVYYLVINEPLQGQEGIEPVQPEYTLIKLGKELHGPEDTLILQKKHILFVENLKDSGKVVSAIKQAKAQAASPAAETPAVPPIQGTTPSATSPSAQELPKMVESETETPASDTLAE